jgi:hypothetical protein
VTDPPPALAYNMSVIIYKVSADGRRDMTIDAPLDAAPAGDELNSLVTSPILPTLPLFRLAARGQGRRRHFRSLHRRLGAADALG